MSILSKNGEAPPRKNRTKNEGKASLGGKPVALARKTQSITVDSTQFNKVCKSVHQKSLGVLQEWVK